MIIHSGSFFGEYEIINNVKRQYSVRAKTDCIVLVLKKKYYLSMLKQCNKIEDLIHAQIINQNRIANQLINYNNHYNMLKKRMESLFYNINNELPSFEQVSSS